MHKPVPRLALIDDEEIDQKQYLRVIRRSGRALELHQFAYADVALDWIRDARNALPDLVLLDINLPRMTGFEFLDALDAETGPETGPSVVMLSTSHDQRDRDRALAYPRVRAFITKPLMEADLLRALDALPDPAAPDPPAADQALHPRSDRRAEPRH